MPDAGRLRGPSQRGGAHRVHLGCENARSGLFQEALRERNLGFDKPCILLRQQDWSSEVKMMEEAVRKTLAHFKSADLVERRPVPLSKLKLGVKCGGSDGFSGISANPAIGEVSDRVVTLGGGVRSGGIPRAVRRGSQHDFPLHPQGRQGALP